VVQSDGFIEALSGPTGFMMIDRKVFAKLDEAYPNSATRMTQIKNGEVVEDLNYPSYFDCITHETEGALGEDISFCKKWEDTGWDYVGRHGSSTNTLWDILFSVSIRTGFAERKGLKTIVNSQA
jgi:hypothetical protein